MPTIKTPKFSPKVESLRAAMIAIERVMGKGIGELAQKYRISPDQVRQTLDLADESGFIDHYKALIYEGCVPKAMAVYETQLAMGNLEAARDILFGMGVLQKSLPEAARLKGKLVDSLEAYRQQRAIKQEEMPHATLVQ